MSLNSVEYEWDKLQQRLDRKFNKYLHYESETSKCEQMNQSKHEQTLCQKNKERQEVT
jgi:hypothetical protein